VDGAAGMEAIVSGDGMISAVVPVGQDCFFLDGDGRLFVANATAPPQTWDNVAMLLTQAAVERAAESFARQTFYASFLWPTFQPPTSVPPAEDLPPSDHGLDGAIPLPEPTWSPQSDDALPEGAWSEQNRRINDLLNGRAG